MGIILTMQFTKYLSKTYHLFVLNRLRENRIMKNDRLTRDETTALYFSLPTSINELKSEATEKEIQELNRLKKRLQGHLKKYSQQPAYPD